MPFFINNLFASFSNFKKASFSDLNLKGELPYFTFLNGKIVSLFVYSLKDLDVEFSDLASLAN